MPARTSTLSQGSRTARESTHTRDEQQAHGTRSAAPREADVWPSSQGQRLGSAVSPIGDHATATKKRRKEEERDKDKGQTEAEGKARGQQTELEEVGEGTARAMVKDGVKGSAEAQVGRRRAVREISPDEEDEDADLDILDQVDEDDAVGQEGEADSAAVQQDANATGQNRQESATSHRQMPDRTMSRRQNSLNDYIATLSVSPPPASQNYARDDPSRALAAAEPLFMTIPEEDEEADDEMQEGHVEGEERVTISERRRRVRSVAQPRASSSTSEATRPDETSFGSRLETSGPPNVDVEEGDKGGGTVLVVEDSEDEDSDAEDLRNGIKVLSVQPATTALDHDHDRDGDDQDMEDEIDVTEPPFDELAPTQRSASPPATPAYARDLQRDGYQSFAEPYADVARRSPSPPPQAPAFALPEGSDEWDIPPEELDMAVQCSIEASLPLASQRQMPRPAGASRRSDRPGHQQVRHAPPAAARPARPGIQPGDGGLAPGWQEDSRPPAALAPSRSKKPLPKQSRSKGKQPMRRMTEDVDDEQQMSGGKERSPSLTPDFNRALSGIFGVDPRGSPSPSGQARIPTYTNIKQSLIEKLGLGDARYSSQRSSSTPSSTSSGSLSSGKRRREGIYSPGGTHKFKTGKDKERSPSLGMQDIKEEEADLRVHNERLILPGLTNVDRIAETEDVKVLIGSELIYELVWQRFIVLAILRYHDTSNGVIDSLLSRPYFAVPWERLTDALRDAAKHAWGRYGSRDRQSSQPITERAWSQRLIGLPFVDGDAIVSSNGSRCDLCEKVHGDRVHYPTIKLKGHVYDDTTFEDVAYETKTMSAGSDCYKRAIEGHRLFHALYRAFHAFETDHFGEHLQKSSALLTMVEDRDVNGVTAYFRDCYDTGDIVSGRRREGERSVQYDIISSIKIGYERYMVSWRLRPEDLGFQVGRLM